MRDLIEKCLYKDPEYRLTTKEILEHPFFDKLLLNFEAKDKSFVG